MIKTIYRVVGRIDVFEKWSPFDYVSPWVMTKGEAKEIYMNRINNPRTKKRFHYFIEDAILLIDKPLDF